MQGLALTDPTDAPPAAWFVDRFYLKLIHDPRDLPFARVQVMNLLVMTALAVWLYIDFRIINVVLFLGWYAFQLGPYTLMLHNVCHRRYFREHVSWLAWPCITVLGVFFGHVPGSYFAHHIGMHHPENNMDDDLSTTLHLQRDSLWDFWVHYLGRFMFLGKRDLAVYLGERNRDKLLRRLERGSLAWFAVVIGLAIVSWQATLVVFVAPVLITRIAMMAGNWGQHAFVDASDPENCYKNSITCINSSYNRRCFNDGYHISHHWKPTRHWTEHPMELQDNLAEYAASDAIVFEKLDFFLVWLFLMLKRYDWLADKYVQIGSRQRSREEIIALLKERTKRIPDRAVTDVRAA
jgi:fatty acid desaturase